MADEELDKIINFISENKGKRKFKQTVELAINFKGIDFSKQDNRLNIDVILPHGKGKVKKIALFASERNLIEEAKKNGIEVIGSEDIEKIAADQARLNSLLDYELIAQPNLMPSIAKSFGQFLGPKGKMPRPLVGSMSMSSVANELNKRIVLKSKGRYLPTVHCVIGNEDMDAKNIYENTKEVIESVGKKIGQNHIKSVYIKLTMTKPLRVM